VEFDRAPFGITGLETAVPLVFERLVHAGRIKVGRAIELLSTNPARVLNLPGGGLSAGSPADVVVIDPDRKVTIDVTRQRSKSKNTPFNGWELRGAVAMTIVGGRVVYQT
jgi:dihydroorotase